jgi:limonene-1,2-epoxide hydrolase
MPWFPEFFSAVEVARKQTRDAGHADPTAPYFEALNSGETHLLEKIWPGEVVVYDPRAGEIRSHRKLHHFISQNHAWLAERHARIEQVALTAAGGRAVLELLAHLNDPDGQEQLSWPVAVVAESPDDLSVVFRTYCSQWPIERQRPVRPAILPPGTTHPGDVIARYQAALAKGDADAIVDTFASEGYYREPIPHRVYSGATELHAFFAERLKDGGIGLDHCAVTDDGVRCVLEYNCIRWGGDDLTPQAGLGVFERAPDGRLAAVRVYDDIESPGDRLFQP